MVSRWSPLLLLFRDLTSSYVCELSTTGHLRALALYITHSRKRKRSKQRLDVFRMPKS